MWRKDVERYVSEALAITYATVLGDIKRADSKARNWIQKLQGDIEKLEARVAMLESAEIAWDTYNAENTEDAATD